MLDRIAKVDATLKTYATVIDDERFDKFAPVVSGGTTKYRVRINEVAFEDGSTLPAPEPK